MKNLNGPGVWHNTLALLSLSLKKGVLILILFDRDCIFQKNKTETHITERPLRNPTLIIFFDEMRIMSMLFHVTGIIR